MVSSLSCSWLSALALAKAAFFWLLVDAELRFYCDRFSYMAIPTAK